MSLKSWFDRMRRRFSGYFGGGTVTPTPTPTPSPTAPVNSSLPVISGSAVKGQTLSVSTGAWLNSTTGFAYDWKRGGVSIGATSSTYVLIAADIGSVITCTVTATNLVGSTAATSAGTSAVIDLAPVNTVLPVITGTPTEGQTLTVSNGTWINTPISYARQWLRNGSAISGATGATYLLVTADNGGNISCTVTATNSGGATPATSASVGPVGAATAAPVNTVLPVLTGAALVGQTLFTGNGSWDITPTSFTYQWYDASGPITGETADNYTVQDADVGKLIHCAVTAYNIAAASSPASSAATSAVTDISLTNAITALTRTSASGVTPMTWSVTFGSNVYEGYTLRAKVYSDSGLATLVQDVAHVLTGPDMVAGATIDLASDGLTAPTATQWLQLGIEATSPHGAFYSYIYGTAISPTDAVVAMTFSALDKDSSVSLSGGNLTAAWGGGGSNYAGVRTNRGLSSGKLYWETTVTNVSARTRVGVASGSASISASWTPSQDGGSTTNQAAVRYGGFTEYDTSGAVSASPTLANADALDTALDVGAKKVWWRVNNGSWLPTGDPAAGTGGLSITAMSTPIFPAAQFSFGGSVTANYGATSFTRTPPTGFSAP